MQRWLVVFLIITHYTAPTGHWHQGGHAVCYAKIYFQRSFGRVNSRPAIETKSCWCVSSCWPRA
jgi:hypothetical protein